MSARPGGCYIVPKQVQKYSLSNLWKIRMSRAAEKLLKVSVIGSADIDVVCFLSLFS